MEARERRRRGILYCVCAIIAWWTCSAEAALPSDPNNAALLYYQAIAAHGGWNPAFAAPMRGERPDEEVKGYFKGPGWPHTMALLKAADRCTSCDWGILYSDGQGLNSELFAKLTCLGNHLDVYARILCDEGEIRSAFETCLTMLRLAGHFGDHTRLAYGTSQRLSGYALGCIRHILSSAQADPDTLVWLRDQLRVVQGTRWRPATALKRIRDMEVQMLRAHPEELARWRQGRKELAEFLEAELARASDDEKPALMCEILDGIRSGLGNASDEEVLSRAVRTYDDFLEAALPIITGDASYGEVIAQLDELEASFEHRDFLDIEIDTLFGRVTHTTQYYELHIWKMVHLNTVRAATEVYLAAEMTGQVPHVLPEGLPKDPYSGRDLQYRKTENGFVLGFDPDNAANLPKREFEFKVQRESEGGP
jgi:hypothetical protein